MQAFYACVQDTVQQYGGTLQPPMVDRALAVFGAPLAQEDHIVRAGVGRAGVTQLSRRRALSSGNVRGRKVGGAYRCTHGTHGGRRTR